MRTLKSKVDSFQQLFKIIEDDQSRFEANNHLTMNNLHYPDIFEPFEKLVEIEISGAKYLVPENNYLLRCFQFLWLEKISFGEFCWNGDCANCQVWLAENGTEKPALACRTKIAENMRIVRMSAEIVNR